MKGSIIRVHPKHYFATILSIVIQIQFSNETSLHYEYNFCYPGTECWARVPYQKLKLWPKFCITGPNQSPINLPDEENPSAIVALNIDRKSYRHKSYYIRNNGHTILLKPISVPIISENNSASAESTFRKAKIEHKSFTYVFAQAHFHWGVNNSVGSEHTINGTSYALEMHLVHYKSIYGSVAKAGKIHQDPSALTVIGLLFEANDEYEDNPHFRKINAHMPLSFQEEPETVIHHFNMRDFLPKRGATFYRYQGSLTTPDCDEIVQWNVFNEPIKISTRDMHKFRKVNDSNGYPLTRNYRPIQHGNGRKIYYLEMQ